MTIVADETITPAWQPKRATIDWFAHFFKATRPVKVVRGKIPGPAKGAMTTSDEMHLIVVDAEIPVEKASLVLAHELVHVRQKERIGDDYDDWYTALEQTFDYQGNPLEVEAREKSVEMTEHGTLAEAV